MSAAKVVDGNAHVAIVATFPGACRLGIRVAGGRLQRIDLLPPGTATRAPAADDPVSCRLVEALNRYFEHAVPIVLDGLPLPPPATAFAARLRRALLAIPAGRTRCYGELAAALGTSARAIGAGCRANPLPVLVPCHRVVARNDSGGYAAATEGPRLDFKRALLAHEAAAGR